MEAPEPEPGEQAARANLSVSFCLMQPAECAGSTEMFIYKCDRKGAAPEAQMFALSTMEDEDNSWQRRNLSERSPM
jgi:hypothetical protein